MGRYSLRVSSCSHEEPGSEEIRLAHGCQQHYSHKHLPPRSPVYILSPSVRVEQTFFLTWCSTTIIPLLLQQSCQIISFCHLLSSISNILFLYGVVRVAFFFILNARNIRAWAGSNDRSYFHIFASRSGLRGPDIGTERCIVGNWLCIGRESFGVRV